MSLTMSYGEEEPCVCDWCVLARYVKHADDEYLAAITNRIFDRATEYEMELMRLRDAIAAIRTATQQETTLDGFEARVLAALDEAWRP